MSSSTSFFVCFFIISQCYFLSTVRCDCCPTMTYENCDAVGSDGFGYNKCGDCTDGTPYCGYGPCNIFKCNCDGGCRKGSCSDTCGGTQTPNIPSGRKRRDAISTNSSSNFGVDDIMYHADEDKDGKLSMAESTKYLYMMEIAIPEDLVRDGIIKLDENKDGFLQPWEIHSGRS